MASDSIDILTEKLRRHAEVTANEPMSERTSMRTGGAADFFIEPISEAALINCLSIITDGGIPFFLMGNGTNVLVKDGGYRGAVISTCKALGGEPGISGNILKCSAGASLSQVCRAAAELGLSGMEGLAGIPGTVGGAVYMNAGAYGDEVADVISSVRAYDYVGRAIKVLSRDEMGLGYRSSLFSKQANGGEPRYVILSAAFELKHKNVDEILTTMTDYQARRTAAQPLNLPSSGSFFKRPEGHYAAALIEEAGQKGRSFGGAEVSRKHAGFIVNVGGATTSDILILSNDVKQSVYAKFGIMLTEEPIIIGEN